MHVVIDIETDSLDDPQNIWVIACKCVDTGDIHVFREVTTKPEEAKRFRAFARNVHGWIGHNLLGFDAPHLAAYSLADCQSDLCFDTLIASKLYDYSRKSHSIEDYGLEFGFPKIAFTDFSHYSKEMEDYCVRDVEICERIYRRLSPEFDDNIQHQALLAEQWFQSVTNDLHLNGFGFNVGRAESLLSKVTKELGELDEQIHRSFPSRLSLVREVHPRLTKHGTLNRTDFRWVRGGDLSDYNGGPFCLCEWRDFNPSSHRQIIQVLNQAGWKPTERTKTYIEKKRGQREGGLDIVSNIDYDIYSWKVNETNLATLPLNAPAPAKTLARRILLESRRRTLVEWLGLVGSDNRIHGKFYGLGAWTQRMAHQAPNTANIPNPEDTQGRPRPYGADMRSLWCAPKNRLLVGVDAEGIQLRIFAHLIDDEEFTYALVNGRKEDKSDPHSLNQRVLGRVCKSRASAKRFIYALLLGAGLGMLASILECSREEAQEALDRLLERYQGWAKLKAKDIPQDAKLGYFIGLDGRKVRIHGETENGRRHLAMSGYLQNGEVVVMKKATRLWYPRVKEIDPTALLVNLVHDEWQTECVNDFYVALKIAQTQADSLREVGEMLGLRCPLAGSFGTDINNFTIGRNWKETH